MPATQDKDRQKKWKEKQKARGKKSVTVMLEEYVKDLIDQEKKRTGLCKSCKTHPLLSPGWHLTTPRLSLQKKNAPAYSTAGKSLSWTRVIISPD